MVAYNEFDPYGNPVAGGGDPYGFTGEWWQDEVSLLHLRARWYAPETGTFLSVDAVESEPAYQYVRGNVVNRIDPSGFQSPEKQSIVQSGGSWEARASSLPLHLNALVGFPEFCRNMATKIDYARCILQYYGLKPAPNPDTGEDIDISEVIGSSKGCWEGPVPYRTWGYLEGVTGEAGVFGTLAGGTEFVYDFANMQSQTFSYGGFGANSNILNPSVSANIYLAYAWGFNSSSENIDVDYGGPFITYYYGRNIGKGPFSGGGLTFNSPDWSMYGYGVFIGAGVSFNDLEQYEAEQYGNIPTELPTLPGGKNSSYGGAWVEYFPTGVLHKYTEKRNNRYTKIDLGKLYWHIVSGIYSPLGTRVSFFGVDPVNQSRAGALMRASIYARVHDQIYIDSYKN
ncbi:MAG: RHS repeat-associated core domain-containing protein [Anaerolineales bacterium]|nr:RHS repeat-associated core domain-containing protein [Anaerolineales bacterium]